MNIPHDINTNLLENHGFLLTAYLGEGAMGKVYQGICNERAVKLEEVDILEADPYDLSVLFMGDKAFTTHSIDGINIAVKVIIFQRNPDNNVKVLARGIINDRTRGAGPQPIPPVIQQIFPQWSAELHLENPRIDFPREANILLGLKHRNVVEIYDVVIDYGNYSVYIVMELMDRTLEDFVEDSNRLTRIQCNDYLTQLINGLDYLHSNGVIHNDIRNYNIMVKETDDGVVIKYVDFGLSTGGGIENVVKDFTKTKDLCDLGDVFVWLVDSSDFDGLNYENQLRRLSDDMIDRKFNQTNDVIILLRDLMENFESEDLSASLRNLFRESDSDKTQDLSAFVDSGFHQ